MPPQNRVARVTADATHASCGCRIPVPAFDLLGAMKSGEPRRGFGQEWLQVPLGACLILWLSVSSNGVWSHTTAFDLRQGDSISGNGDSISGNGVLSRTKGFWEGGASVSRVGRGSANTRHDPTGAEIDENFAGFGQVCYAIDSKSGRHGRPEVFLQYVGRITIARMADSQPLVIPSTMGAGAGGSPPPALTPTQCFCNSPQFVSANSHSETPSE